MTAKTAALTTSDLNTSILRGLAILGIFLHNFCHWREGVVKENLSSV